MIATQASAVTAGFTWRHVLYRFYDASGELLYVGITNNIDRRFVQHAQAQPWWSEVADCKIEFLPDRDSLRTAEKIAIRSEKPRYNRKDILAQPVMLTVRLMPESLEQIDEVAQRNGWTRADAVRSLLRDGLAAQGKTGDIR